MIAVGVARPSAQGQAISSTAMAWASACVAGAPPSSQPPAVTAGNADDARNEARGDPVGQLLDRQFGTLRLRRPCARCAPAPCRWPTAVARSVSAPFWFMQPPITLSPAALPTGRLSPVSMDSSTAELPAITSPSVGTSFAGPHQQGFAGDDGLDIDDHLDTVADDGRGRRLQFDELADRFAGLALGALFQIAAEQHEGDDARRRLEIEEVRAPVRQQAG